MTDPAPVAFCLPRRHRHPGLHCFRRSIPRLYVPLSTLRVLPHSSVPRLTRGSVDRYSFTVTDLHRLPPAGLPAHRGSMAGLCPPLPTLRRRPYGRQRTARGRCGSLLLHRSGLAPPTPCRSPGALRVRYAQPDSPVSTAQKVKPARNRAVSAPASWPAAPSSHYVGLLACAEPDRPFASL